MRHEAAAAGASESSRFAWVLCSSGQAFVAEAPTLRDSVRNAADAARVHIAEYADAHAAGLRTKGPG